MAPLNLKVNEFLEELYVGALPLETPSIVNDKQSSEDNSNSYNSVQISQVSAHKKSI